MVGEVVADKLLEPLKGMLRRIGSPWIGEIRHVGRRACSNSWLRFSIAFQEDVVRAYI